MDSVVDLLYVIDMCLRFRTYHFSSKGDLVLEQKPIRDRYLRSLDPSFSFAVDMMATVPPAVAEVLVSTPGYMYI